MAAIRKPAKKKDSSNPSTVLVLFLVFFILLSIGLGVWGYYGYAGQKDLEKRALDAKNAQDAAKLGEGYYGVLARDFIVAQGHNLDKEQRDRWENERTEFMTGGKFAKEPTYDAFKKMVLGNEKQLGFDGKKYKTTYQAELARLDKDLKNSQAALQEKQTELDKAAKDLELVKIKNDKYWKQAIGEIQKGNKETLEAAQKRTQDFDDAVQENKNLLDKMTKMEETHQEEVRKLNRELQKTNEQLAKGAEGAAQAKGPREVHALLLDISPGKALWDEPVGRILSADHAEKTVQINVGSAQGVRPQLTFNVFGKGPDGRAAKGLKGTIEVIRVLGPSASVARITSVYDAKGVEIAMSDPTYGRLKRETENAMKEGDLLYNLTFGAHVAIAGAPNWGGAGGGSPAELMRDLQSYISFLGRQGVTVDAYVDLTDGQVKGALTSKTRFLVRGAELRSGEEPGKENGAKKEAKGEEAVEEKEKKDEKAEPKEGAAPAAGLDAVNQSIQSLRNQAVERGLFIISPQNLAIVTGYRPPRSADSLSVSSFRPTPPTAPRPTEVPGPAKKEEAKEKTKEPEPQEK